MIYPDLRLPVLGKGGRQARSLSEIQLKSVSEL